MTPLKMAIHIQVWPVFLIQMTPIALDGGAKRNSILVSLFGGGQLCVRKNYALKKFKKCSTNLPQYRASI